MSDHIIPFLFEEEHLVRTIEKGIEPWFVGPDIAGILGHRDANTALRGLDDDEKGTHILRTLGGMQEVTIVSEPGVYQLVFTSRKPVALRLKRWLAHEVIPQIRRTGSYAPQDHANDRPYVARASALREEPINVRRQVVGEARQTFGNQAAREVWFAAGLIITPSMCAEADQSEFPFTYTAIKKSDAEKGNPA